MAFSSWGDDVSKLAISGMGGIRASGISVHRLNITDMSYTNLDHSEVRYDYAAGDEDSPIT